MSLYMIANSNYSDNYFPTNTESDFRVHLNNPLILNGPWKVALVECEMNSSLSNQESVFLYSNICDDSIVNGYKKPLLRRILNNGPGNWCNIFETPHYMTVKVQEITDIHFYITDAKDQIVSFIDQPLTLTLHFKAFPFF